MRPGTLSLEADMTLPRWKMAQRALGDQTSVEVVESVE